MSTSAPQVPNPSEKTPASAPAFSRSRRPHPARKSFSRTGAFTLTELLTVIAIIGVLAAIIIPTVGKVRESARSSQCASNLRQVFNLYMIDVQENRGRTPADVELDPVTQKPKSIVWIDRIAAKYFAAAESKGISQSLGCPIQIDLKPNVVTNAAKSQRAPRTYSLNRDLTRDIASPYTPTVRALASFVSPPRTVLAGDGNDSDNSTEYYTGIIGSGGRPPETPHGGKANLVFLDGHVEAVADQSLLKAATPKAGTPQALFWFGQ